MVAPDSDVSTQIGLYRQLRGGENPFSVVGLINVIRQSVEWYNKIKLGPIEYKDAVLPV